MIDRREQYLSNICHYYCEHWLDICDTFLPGILESQSVDVREQVEASESEA